MSTIRANTVTDAAGTGSPNFPNGLSVASPALTGTPTAPTASNGTNTTQIATTAFVLANAPASGNQTFTAVGSIAAGSIVVASSTANSVETIGVMANGQTNGSLQNYGSSTGAAGFYNHGRPCPMTSNTFIQARVSTTAPYPISAAVVTVAADGTLTTGTFTTAVAAASYTGSPYNYVIKISTDKFIIFYATGSGNTIYAIVGTVSGTTITFGTGVAVQAATTYFVDAATNGAGQVLVYCTNGTSPYASKVVALTISGTTITVGSAVTFYSLAAYANNNGSPDLIAYDPIADRYFVVWAATTAAGSPIYGGVFSVSGTTVTTVTTASLGAELLKSQLSTPGYYARTLYVKYVPSIGRMALIIGPTTAGELFVSTVLVSTSGFTRNTLSLNMGATSSNTVWSSNTGEIIVLPDSTVGYSIGFAPTTYQPYKASMGSEIASSVSTPCNALGNGYYVSSGGNPYVEYVMAVTNATKAIGLANATVTNGQSLSVAVTGGLCSSLSGLTSGNAYYVTGKGVVTQDNSAIKFIGTAVSTTSMLVGI